MQNHQKHGRNSKRKETATQEIVRNETNMKLKIK